MADHDDQDDETPGTSSSRAFAELPNPIILATPMLTRSQRAERFTTPLQPNAPFNPALKRIAEENEYRASRPSPSQNPSPGGGPADQTLATTTSLAMITNKLEDPH
jgi:hypothetical protein